MSRKPRSTTPAANPALPRRTLLGAALLVGPSVMHHDIKEQAADMPDRPPDALILSLCRRVRQLEMSNVLNDAAWDSTVRHLSTLLAQSTAGVLAKAQLLQSLLPSTADSPAAERASPDEQLLASLLHDLLGNADARGFEA